MRYCILIYQVAVDNHVFRCTVGRATKNVDGMLAETKSAIEDGYTRMHPGAGSVYASLLRRYKIGMLEYLSFAKLAQNPFN